MDEKLTSKISESSISKGMTYNYDKYGNRFSTSLKESQQFKKNTSGSNIQSLTYNLNRSYHSYYNHTLGYGETNYFDQFRTSKSGNYSYHNSDIFKSTDFTQTINFSHNDNHNDTLVADERLINKSIFKKTIFDDVSMEMKLDYALDLDEERVTSDSKGGNNYLNRLPEFTFKKSNYDAGWFKGTSTVVFGHYKEIYYNSSEQEEGTFPVEDHSFLEPNIYHFTQVFSKTKSDLPLKSTFTFSTTYDQYVFSNDGKDIFSGDAQYSIGINTSLTSTLFNFIEHTSTYSSLHAPEENNSPFHVGVTSLKNLKKNEISENLDFFYTKSELEGFPYSFNFRWNNSTRYNWERDGLNWDPYKTDLTLGISSRFTLKMNMTQKLNYTNYDSENIYTPLGTTITIKPTLTSNITYTSSINLNKWTFDDTLDINSSTITFSVPLWTKEEYECTLSGTFNYDRSKQILNQGQGANPKFYDFSLYELRTYSITKEEHRRTLKVSYTKNSNKKNDYNLDIEYRFTLFPDDPIIIEKKEDLWKFKGRFSGTTQDRF